MNFVHKCHFHPNHNILKFCPQKQCTLPLCEECEPIHIEEHQAQYHKVNLMKFNEAYLQASRQIEVFLKEQKGILSREEKKLEDDRNGVLKFIEEYYVSTRKSMEEIKGKYNQVEDKLNKLKKGSIKTLIYYFSGDIELTPQQFQFQSLLDKIRMPSKREETPQPQVIITKIQNVSKQIMKEAVKVRPSSVQKTITPPIDNTNIFNSIDELKLGDRNRQKTRKSIFENVKKTDQEEHRSKQKSVKYNYNVNPIVENQEERDHVQPKNHTYQQHRRLVSGDIKKEERDRSHSPSRSREREHETPVSFQNRYNNNNKFTGSEQYQEYKKQREDKIFKHIDCKDNRRFEDKQNFGHKILKPSDLDYQPTEQVLTKPGSNPVSISSQRLRSFSHTNLGTNQQKLEEHGYDLKKQVLAPEQIRKMLEKRMEERNRILTFKKNETFANTGDALRKGYQTKDSIINQIYVDPRH